MKSFLLFALAATALWSQEFRAGIVGVVLDTSDAAINGAEVTMTNLETNLVTRTVTTGTGNYAIAFLTPGPYRLEVRHPGFKAYRQDRIILKIQERPTVDVKLEPGDVTTSITVDATVSQLETSTASRGEVITERKIVDMPLNGRSVFMLGLLTPGTTFTSRGPSNFFVRTTSTNAMSTIAMSGGEPSFNEALLDGVPNTGGNGLVQFVPSVEATQEFKVQTNSFDAEYGRFTGGVINATTKSGTNQFHGVLFEFMRNSVFNARETFATAKPQFGYNIFGGSAGGPVYLPRIYDGRNRTFFFVNMEASREGVSRATLTSLPTDLQRSGDFSGTFLRQGTAVVPVTIYDPGTLRLSGTAFTRDPFPGNRVPQSQFNPVATRILAQYPRPNGAGDAVTGANNFALAYKDPVLDNGLVIRVDHRFSDRHQIFGRYSWRHFFVGSNRVNPLNEFNGTANKRWAPGFAFDDTYTINSRTVLNLRYGFSRLYMNNPSSTYGFDATTLGLPAALVRDMSVAAFPVIAVSGFVTLSRTALARQADDSHALRGSLSRVTGVHSLKFGGETRVVRASLGSPASDAAGSFTFNNGFTRGPNPQANVATAGHGLASFLLGLPASGSVSKTAFTAEQTLYYGFFAQDDLRLTSRLTMNLGLRYEWEGGTTERFNRFNRGFDYTSPIPITNQAQANYAARPIPELPASQFLVRGGLLFTGVNGQPRGIANTDTNNVGPRVGFAYRLPADTVLRGGYGMFYGATSLLTEQKVGFSQSTPFVASIDGGLRPLNTLTNPFPDGLLSPAGAALGLMTSVGQGLSFVDVHRRNPMTHQMHVGVQHEFFHSLLVEASYAASFSRDLPVTRTLGFVPAQLRNTAFQTFLQTGRNILNDSVPNPFFGLIATGSLASATTTRGQLVRDYPQYTSLNRQNESIGSSRYDSFQLKVSRRMSYGLSLLASYTIAKQLEQLRFLNDQDAALTKEIVDYNVPQRLVISGSWELPFGPGRTWWANSPQAARRLLEGWQLNVIYTAQGGVPLELSGGESTGVSAKLPSDKRSPTRWFDTSAFRQRQTLELVGTAKLPDLRSAGANNFDISVFKITKITERLKIQFRAESFNSLNRVEYDRPNTTFGSANFGVITGANNIARQLQFGLRLLW